MFHGGLSRVAFSERDVVSSDSPRGIRLANQIRTESNPHRVVRRGDIRNPLSETKMSLSGQNDESPVLNDSINQNERFDSEPREGSSKKNAAQKAAHFLLAERNHDHEAHCHIPDRLHDESAGDFVGG